MAARSAGAPKLCTRRSTNSPKWRPEPCSAGSSHPVRASPTPGSTGPAQRAPTAHRRPPAATSSPAPGHRPRPGHPEPTLEVAHEALLTRWTRLGEWIDEDRRWLAQLQHLAAAARGWDERGRPADGPVPGFTAKAAIEALDEGREVSHTERDYVVAGRDARDAEIRSRAERRGGCAGCSSEFAAACRGDRRRHARLRRATAGQPEERDAALRALVSNSMALRANKREDRRALAIEPTASPPAQPPSRRCSACSPRRRVDAVRAQVDHGGDAIMPRQRHAGAAEANRHDPHRRHSQRCRRVQPDPSGPRRRLHRVALSDADGRYLATAWRDGPAHVVCSACRDLPNQAAALRQHRRAVFAMGTVALSPDGTFVAIGGGPDARTTSTTPCTGSCAPRSSPFPAPTTPNITSTRWRLPS